MRTMFSRLPRKLGLWVPVFMLPLVLGEIWLHATGGRPNPGVPVAMAAMIIVLCWYMVGGTIAVASFIEGLAQRRALARLRPKLRDSTAIEWAVDPDGLILEQTEQAHDGFGDLSGHRLNRALHGLIADAEATATRLLGRARRLGKARASLPDGRVLIADSIDDAVLRLTLTRPKPVPDPVAPAYPPFECADMPLPILNLAPDGTVLDVSVAAAEYCGEVAPGDHISRIFDGLGRAYEDWLAEALGAAHPPPPEVLRTLRKGQDRFIQVALYAAQDGSGSLLALLSDARPVKTLEAQFVQSQKMQAIGQLAGGIAHDFNNLLTAISGHCDLLMLRHDKGDPDFADLDQISQNTNRAANLVSHLLAFSRKQKLKPQRLDLRDTLSDLSHLLNRLVGETITLYFNHPPRLNAVRADRGKIEQVIMNLVVNARDAMPHGGAIRIETRDVAFTTPQSHARFSVPEGDYVQITVADEGTGIAPDLLSKIFEPFFTTKRMGEGTGLGLSTAYGIVKQTGGYILCDSTLGKGTTFTIYLPAYHGADEPEDVAAPASPAVALSAPPGRCVLLVEDEAPVRAFASRALKLAGYTVIEAASAEEALATLEDEGLAVDIFVTDVVMPGLDGLSWVRRALRDRPHTPVIFMSGYTEDVFEEGRIPIDGASFLQKPFSLKDLVAAVGDKLEAKGA